MTDADKLITQNIPFALDIIKQYYQEDTPLYTLLLTHSLCVAKKAIEISKNLQSDIDFDFLTRAALLHDIGIFKCNAPSIYCIGELPYICHGIVGSEILRKKGYENLALVCERHTGAGFTTEEIIQANLPLPHRDMLPITIEEKAICYADKFFSKSVIPDYEKTLTKVEQEMAKHGETVLYRFKALHNLFS